MHTAGEYVHYPRRMSVVYPREFSRRILNLFSASRFGIGPIEGELKIG